MNKFLTDDVMRSENIICYRMALEFFGFEEKDGVIRKNFNKTINKN